MKRKVFCILALALTAVVALSGFQHRAWAVQNCEIEGYVFHRSGDIGYPLDGVEIYIYDKDDVLVWQGVTGYLDQPECWDPEALSGLYSTYCKADINPDCQKMDWTPSWIQSHEPLRVKAIYNNDVQQKMIYYEDFGPGGNPYCDSYLAAIIDFTFPRLIIRPPTALTD